MKREYYIGILLALIGAGLVVFFLTRDRNNAVNQNAATNNAITNTATENTNRSVVSNSNVNADNAVTLNLATISLHDSISDCWLVLNGRVYDVTAYLPGHPGGPGLVTPYCGQPDGTDAFKSKDGRGDHSAMAYSQLARYLLGDLNSTINVD